MQYIALIHTDRDLEPKPGSPDFGPYMGGYMEANKCFRENNVMVSGEPLEAPSTATTLRVRGGKVDTMDGPFAETKEQLGGFYIFECPNLDEALKYAAMIPGAMHGAVEVRPIMKLPY